MKALLLFVISNLVIAGECYLPPKSTWIERGDGTHKLMIEITNARNLYISYYNEKSESKIELSHKIYSCDEKFLYVVDEDQYVKMYAAIEPLGKSGVRLYFVDDKEIVKSVLTFHRF